MKKFIVCARYYRVVRHCETRRVKAIQYFPGLLRRVAARNDVSPLFFCLIFIMCISLSACSKHRDAKQEVDSFVKSVETASATQKKEDEKQTVVEPVIYEGAKSRDPFEEPIISHTAGKQYDNTILKDAALDSLKLVGIVIQDNFRLAVFRANDGKLYKAAVGTRIGVENSLLTQIDENQVKFIQESEGTSTTEAPGGVKREIIVHLQEPKS